VRGRKRRRGEKRIDHLWDKFVVPDWGVRCVSDRPWVTMAETSEFILTLSAIEDDNRAKTIFSWLGDKRYPDGSYWMGVTFPDTVIWPEEKPVGRRRRFFWPGMP